MNRHYVISVVTCALGMMASVYAAQDVPEFEFVSVRRSAPPTVSARSGEFLVLPGGRLEVRGESLANLTRVAFGFDHADPGRGVVKAADWMWNDRFDITAAAAVPWTTPPVGTKVPAELRPMLRALLEDRFALRARIASTKVDVTAMRLVKPDKLGPKLRPSSAECLGPFTEASPGEASPRPRCPFELSSNRLEAQAVTMPEVARLIVQMPLLKYLGSIVDQTGLPGLYDVSFSRPQRTTSPVGLIFAQLEDQLGVRLKETNMPLPTLIIEGASRPREE
jgi:uncharacterized protein (TIGR03435 family)